MRAHPTMNLSSNRKGREASHQSSKTRQLSKKLVLKKSHKEPKILIAMETI